MQSSLISFYKNRLYIILRWLKLKLWNEVLNEPRRHLVATGQSMISDKHILLDPPIWIVYI